MTRSRGLTPPSPKVQPLFWFAAGLILVSWLLTIYSSVLAHHVLIWNWLNLTAVTTLLFSNLVRTSRPKLGDAVIMVSAILSVGALVSMVLTRLR